jgi:hypothetical protein
MPVGMYGGGSGGGNSGPSFFDLLFGGRAQAAPQPYRPRNFIGPRAGNEGRFSRR